MTLNDEERRLFVLFYSGSVISTANILRDALTDITEPDERVFACSLLRKLEGLSEADILQIEIESEALQ